MERIGDTLKSLPPPAPRPLPPGVVLPAPPCPACQGAGYLRLEVPVGHPNFGRMIPCTCKLAELQAETAARQALADIPGLGPFGGQTFATFDPDVPGVGEAWAYCRQYAANPHGWLLLIGLFGCGKTHLAAAIAHEAHAVAQMAVQFAVAPDLLDQLRATYAPGSDSEYDSRFEAIRAVPLLIIDDLGSEQASPWAREKLYQIFNHRYNHRLPTVITTNEDLGEIDPRIASRLSDQALCTHLVIPAADYRRQRQSAATPIPLYGPR